MLINLMTKVMAWRLEQQLQHQQGDFSSRLTSFLQYEHNSFDDKLQDSLTKKQQHYYGDSQGDTMAAGSRFDADWSTLAQC